jgi:putative tricarboxylic transport membrane protein
MKARSADFWSGLALGGLGAYIIVVASGWEYMGQDGPGPGFFPLWYGIVMAVLSLMLMVASVTSKDGSVINWSGARSAFLTWGAFTLMVATLKLVGFVIGFAALTFFIVLVMYRKPLKVAAFTAIGLAASFYVVFPLALGVQLP